MSPTMPAHGRGEAMNQTMPDRPIRDLPAGRRASAAPGGPTDVPAAAEASAR